MVAFQKQLAPDGDVIVGCYALALEAAGAVRLSLGICDSRCSSLKDLAPMAFGWRGTDPASLKRCPLCGNCLKRLSRHCWDRPIQLLGVKE